MPLEARTTCLQPCPYPLYTHTHVLLTPAGIPVKQQVLWYAGNQLKDHLSLAEHNLEAYTLSEV